MIKDIIDGLKLVAEGINSIRTIQGAIKSGANYLKVKHPEVQSDLRAMVSELGKSLSVIKRASAVLTNFQFAIAADTRGSELARFNNYFIHSKDEAQHLREHIDDLRTHCGKIREHAMKISKEATAPGFAKIFHLLGLNSPTRELELGKKLDSLAYEDFEIANSAEIMLTCLEMALRDVQNALGVGGAMYPENIPVAAALLAELGPEFEKMEEQAAVALREVQLLAKELE